MNLLNLLINSNIFWDIIKAIISGMFTIFAVYIGFRLVIRQYIKQKSFDKITDWYIQIINELSELDSTIIDFQNYTDIDDEKTSLWKNVLKQKYKVIRILKEGDLFIDWVNKPKIDTYILKFNEIGNSDEFLPYSKHINLNTSTANRNKDLILLLEKECEEFRNAISSASMDFVDIYRKKSKNKLLSFSNLFEDLRTDTFDKNLSEFVETYNKTNTQNKIVIKKIKSLRRK